MAIKVPMVISKDFVVITGHTRLKAVTRLGWETVPCVYADDLTPQQAEAFRLIDNKSSEMSTWDESKTLAELKKIAAIAEANYIPFAPHNPSGPIANAATLQLAACCPNFCILEIMYSDVDWRKDVTDESLVYENGRIKIGDKPGLGIDLNEEECLKHPYVEHNLRHYTGALTDIRPAKTEFYY